MSEIVQVIEFKEEGIAIIEDTKGKFLASKANTDLIPLYDYEAYFGNRKPCALLQSREAMLT